MNAEEWQEAYQALQAQLQAVTQERDRAGKRCDGLMVRNQQVELLAIELRNERDSLKLRLVCCDAELPVDFCSELDPEERVNQFARQFAQLQARNGELEKLLRHYRYEHSQNNCYFPGQTGDICGECQSVDAALTQAEEENQNK